MRTDTDIWAFIPIAEFTVPSPPVAEATRGQLMRLWQSFQKLFDRSNGRKSNPKADLERPSDDTLRRVSPSLDENQAAVLAAALGDEWFENSRLEAHVRTVVGPPGCKIGAVLRTLAKERQFEILDAPSTESIFNMSNAKVSSSLAQFDSGMERVVIPHLERFFLRHENGLSLVRALVDRLTTGTRRVLVGCNSWAWAFLNEAIGIEDVLGSPLTWAPFDADRLDAWFRSTLSITEYEIRQRGSDDSVFPDASAAESKSDLPKPEVSALFKNLAAQARGNPGVALALWQECLRTADGPANAGGSSGKKPQADLWALSLADVNVTEHDIEHTDRFILHAVLLHGGLSKTTILSLLPFSRDEVLRRVNLLINSGVLEEQATMLRVSRTSYPWVRKNLSSEGFLTDAF